MTSTTRRGPTLPDLWKQLLASAKRSGRDQSMTLGHGARLTVRVEANQITFSIARQDTPVGDTELITFRVNCCIPAEAIRWPETGQNQIKDKKGQLWHRVVFRWLEVPDASPDHS